MLDVVVQASLLPMHSSVSRAANGSNSAKRACELPNRFFISDARNEPKASAASSGNVIMPRRSLQLNVVTVNVDRKKATSTIYCASRRDFAQLDHQFHFHGRPITITKLLKKFHDRSVRS